jgi:predicted O-methyltransferase YrrM
MDCIFLTAFSSNIDEILNIIYIQLESINIYGNLNNTTEILIYTTTEIMNKIEESQLYYKNIKFEINDTAGELASFKLASLLKYSKILYINNNVFVSGDVNNLFELLTDDKLYGFGDKRDVLLFTNKTDVDTATVDITLLADYVSIPSTDATKEVLYYQTTQPLYNEMLAKFLKNKDDTINAIITKTKNYITAKLIPHINDSCDILERSIFTLQHTAFNDHYINRAKNICSYVLNKNVTNILEVGFNAGFSSLLMLMANPNLKVISIDIGMHGYTVPCYNEMKTLFGDRITLVIGDSMVALPPINEKFDIINIDGGTNMELIVNDTIHSYRLAKSKSILIMNNINMNMIWYKYKDLLGLKKLNVYTYQSENFDVAYV